MKKQNLLTKLLLLCMMIVGSVNGVWAQTVLFSQDFSQGSLTYTQNVAYTKTSGIANLVGDGDNLFTSIQTTNKNTTGIAINSATGGNSTNVTGYFQAYFNNTGGYWYVCRTRDFAATAPTAIKMTVDVWVNIISGSNNALGVQFAIGDGFTDGTTSYGYAPMAGNYGYVHSGFGITAEDSPTIAEYAAAGTDLYNTALTESSWLSFTWIINNTGDEMTYDNPTGSGTSTVSDDCFDLWMKTRDDGDDKYIKVVSGKAASKGSIDLQEMYIGSTGGKKMEFRMDNIVVTDLTPKTYSVTFDAGSNGTCDTSSLTEASVGAGVTLPTATPNSGYAFNGWYTASSGGTKEGDAGAKYYPKDDVTLYAQYSETDAPSIVTQPTGGVFAKEASVTLSVEASPSTGEECGYQWYSCDDAEKTNAAAVEDETSDSFSPSSATAGNYYYFCRVSDGGSNTTDTEVVRVRISPRAAVSTWDITTLQEGDVKYNTEFWTNSATYTYTHGGITSGTTITAQNNFGTDLLNGITLGRNGGEGTITLFVDNTHGRYAIGVMGNTSKPGVIKVPVESEHYYRVTYCSCNDSQTLGFAVSGADATGTTATLSTRYTSTASFIAKATSTEMTLTNDGTGANYVMLVKIEEVEALDGAWSVASDAVYRGDAAPSTPTFAVTPSNGGSATLGTEYSVSYALKDGSTDGIVTVNSSTGITAISTATVGTATVTATVTDLIDDDEFVVETATYEYSITVNTPVAPTISATTGANTVPQNYSTTLTATVNGAPAPTIQWYSNTTASNEGGVAIDGATNTSYAPSTSVLGTYYYYAVATNSAGSATSSVITLKVAEYAPIFSANASAALDVDPSTDLAPYTEITSTNATITGGSMYAHNGQITAKTLVVPGNSGSFAFTNNNTNFKVVLSKALQAGDIISSKVGNSKDYGIKIYTTEALGGYGQADATYDAIILNTTGSFGLEKPYIIKPSDTNLIGATTLYIYRATGNGTYFDELTISREVLTPGTITFDPEDGETLSPDTEISLASNRATSLKWQWGSVAVDDPEDDSWSSAQTYADNNKPAAGAIGSTDNVLSVLATNAHGSVVSSASYTFRGASDLAFVNGRMLAVKGAESISYTFAADKDYTTSSDGAITLTSSNTNVATVDGTDGMKINFVDGAVGITTITLTQAETSSYASGSLVFTVAATGTHVVPSTTLDLSNATTSKTTLTGTWNSTGDKPYYGNDGTDNYMVFSSYSAYASNTNQTWINQPKSGTQIPTSLNAVWSPTGVFLGSKGYPVSVANFGTNDGKAKFASINAQSSADDVSNRRARTWHAYQVKGISKTQILANATSASYNIMLAVYEVDGSVAASTTHMNYISGNSDQVVTVGGLDVNKTYLVTISTDRTQNVYFYETAFFFSTDLGITETITPAYNKTTYVTRSSMDFTGTGLRAYVATDHDGNNTGVTMTRVEQVPAGTPILLAGTASTAYTIPVGSYADALATNYLKGGDNSTTFDGTTDDFLLYSDGIFYLIGSGKIAVNKAYLHLENTNARSLSINFDDEDETTGIKDLQGKKAEINGDVYDLSGRKVAQPRKGLYIVNGRKVVIK